MLLLVFLAQIQQSKSYRSLGNTATPGTSLPKVAPILVKISAPVQATERNAIPTTQQERNAIPFFSGKTLIEHGAMGTKKIMVWNEATSCFKYHSESKFSLRRALHGHFFPSGELTPDYYKYAMWRATQRLVSATNSVFGTQALLMALGFNKQRIGKRLSCRCMYCMLCDKYCHKARRPCVFSVSPRICALCFVCAFVSSFRPIYVYH